MAQTKKALEPKAKARYQQLSGTRQTALQRAIKNSSLTIPGLIPENGQDANSSFTQPYQSLGARCINNLAAWLLLALFPPDQQFSRMSIHEDTAEELGGKLSEVQTALQRISSKAHLLLETSASRPVFMEVLRHLIVAGNALLHIPVDGLTPRMFRLDQYVVLRDERGGMLEAAIHEKVYPSSLDEATISDCKIELKPGEENEKLVDLYTHVFKDGEQYRHYQEINGIIVPGSEGASPLESTGWLALRWQAIPGSDYGRAHVSEYVGDLMSLEDLNKAIIQFAAVASRIVFMVDPNGMVDIEELNEAETGDYVNGYIDKVKALQLEKLQDFSVASQVAERLELRLSHAFMLQSGTVRDAERVTAEEIRAMAQELENVLGGVYTVLSAELQLPLIRRYIYILQRTGEAPDLPDTVQPVIVTGFEALGRNHAANKLKQYMSDLKEMGIDPSTVVNVDEVALRLADNYGLEDIQSLVKSPDQQDADAKSGVMNEAMVRAAPQLAAGVTQAINQPTDPATAAAAPTPEQGAAQ